MVQFRKTKNYGPVRVTTTQSGIGVSVGIGPLRISRGADGKFRRTTRIPGSGVWDTKIIGGGKKK